MRFRHVLSPQAFQSLHIPQPHSAEPQAFRPTALIDEMTTMMLVEHDAEVRFRLRAASGAGKTARGLAPLKKAAAQS